MVTAMEIYESQDPICTEVLDARPPFKNKDYWDTKIQIYLNYKNNIILYRFVIKLFINVYIIILSFEDATCKKCVNNGFYIYSDYTL